MAYLPESTANHNTVPRHYQLFFNVPPAGQAVFHRPQEPTKTFSFIILCG